MLPYELSIKYCQRCLFKIPFITIFYGYRPFHILEADLRENEYSTV